MSKALKQVCRKTANPQRAYAFRLVCRKTAKPKRIYAFGLLGLRFSWLAPGCHEVNP
jgi:hypothetical protein